MLVIDTNVPLTANLFPADKADCPLKCVRELKHIFDGSARLVIDDAWRIIREYKNKLRPQEPGVGNEFLKWVLTNHANPARCERVTITPRVADPAGGEDWEQFPTAAELAVFDWPDRKFVAVANGHPGKPPILQATDSKWLGWYRALREAGVRVRFICHADAVPLYEQKMGKPAPEVREEDRE